MTSLVAQMVKGLPTMSTMREIQVQSLGQEDPLEKEMATPFNSCLENSMDRGAGQATVCGITELDPTL